MSTEKKTFETYMPCISQYTQCFHLCFKLRHFLPEERSLHESITHKTEQETPPLTIVCKQRKEYDQPAEKTPFSDNVDMDQIKREIMDITVCLQVQTEKLRKYVYMYILHYFTYFKLIYP